MKLPIILFFTAVLFSMSFSSCNKNKLHPVPNIPFDIDINIALPTYSDLTNVGGYAFVNGGSKGIIVYRRNVYEFVAFDLHSPANDGECDSALVNDDENFLQLKDLCSGARFSLIDGSPISGSDFGLRAYVTAFDGNSFSQALNIQLSFSFSRIKSLINALVPSSSFSEANPKIRRSCFKRVCCASQTY